MDPSKIDGTPQAAAAEALDTVAPVRLAARKAASRLRAAGIACPFPHFGGGMVIGLRPLSTQKLSLRVEAYNQQLLEAYQHDARKKREGKLDGRIGVESTRFMLVNAVMWLKGRFILEDGSEKVFDGTESAADARLFISQAFLPQLELDKPNGEDEELDGEFLSAMLDKFNAINNISAEELAAAGKNFVLAPTARVDYSE